MLSTIKHIWSYFSNAGILPEIDDRLKRKVVLTNQIAMTATLMTVGQIGMFSASNQYVVACLIAASLYSMVLVFNRLGFFNFSRLYFSIIPNFIIIIIGSSISGDKLMAYKFMLLGTIVCPLIVFELKERQYLIISIAWALLSYLSFDLVNPHIPIFPNIDVTAVDNAVNIAINSIVTYASLILGYIYLQRLNVRAEHSLQQSLSLTESQKRIISTKNKKLTEVLDITQKQKDIIQAKNKHIQDSINYSQSIQTAIMPSPRELMNAIPDLFIFFEPKDVISGDFYWYNQIGNKKVLVVADCTGHGVPGALLSMVGSNLLDRIVMGKGISDPGEILFRLDMELCRVLRTSGKQINDGMDVAIAVLEDTSNTLHFAGAKQSLIYIEENQLFQVKGDRRSIGGKRPEDCSVFTTHTIDYSQKCPFYMFTDGICDQFGGQQSKKFMVKRLKQFFLENHPLPFIYQRELLVDMLLDWQGSEERVDDILVIGFSPDLNIPQKRTGREKHPSVLRAIQKKDQL